MSNILLKNLVISVVAKITGNDNILVIIIPFNIVQKNNYKVSIINNSQIIVRYFLKSIVNKI